MHAMGETTRAIYESSLDLSLLDRGLLKDYFTKG
jgi:hypothetical protein